jgi:hypothetical protein
MPFGPLDVGIAFGGQDPPLDDEGLSFCNTYIINTY